MASVGFMQPNVSRNLNEITSNTADNIVNVTHKRKAEEFDKNGHVTGYYSDISERYEAPPLDHSDYDFSMTSYTICNVVRTFLSEKGKRHGTKHLSRCIRNAIIRL